jgi:hypothetical protein
MSIRYDGSKKVICYHLCIARVIAQRVYHGLQAHLTNAKALPYADYESGTSTSARLTNTLDNR